MYTGPGLYRHYKGGHYLVLGIGVHESRHTDQVVYVSMDANHQASRMDLGKTFVLRPLTEDDVEDVDREAKPFNTPVRTGSESQAPRFVKIA